MGKTRAPTEGDDVPMKRKLFNVEHVELVFTAANGTDTVTIPPKGRIELAVADISSEMETAIRRGRLLVEE